MRAALCNDGRSRRFVDLTGKVFERLTVIEYRGRRSHSSSWLCRCECGTEKVINAGPLKNGTIKSCGCFGRDRMSTLTFKHGATSRNLPRRTPEYKAWEQMRARCTDSRSRQWKWYGGKGVTVHPAWMDDFSQFLRDVGMRPVGSHSLDRIDSNGNYEPGNVRWATWTQQARNRSNNRRVEFNGRMMTMVEAAEAAGIPYVTVKSRMQCGWTIERALITPVHKKKSDAARRNPGTTERAS